MLFPDTRPRRLRQNATIRKMVRETRLHADQLILPLFAISGKNVEKPVSAMPGQFQLSCDLIAKKAKEAYSLGIPAVLLFGVPDKKDPLATEAYKKDGIIQRAVQAVRNAVPEMMVITDVCLCGFMDHGHCGILEKGKIDNDASLDLLARTAVSHAQAGAQMVAPSDMMDGRVAEIREGLDQEGYIDTLIMSYAVKYASAYYGPFREAAANKPASGDRKSYQMDPANAREAIREATMDVEEGADIIMVKPALPYLDIIKTLRDELDLPLAAYNVSGEYALIKAAAERGWVDGDAIMMETLLSITRAGADMILTYFAMDAAKILNG